MLKGIQYRNSNKLTEGTMYRSLKVDREKGIDKEARTVELSFASETPVERWGDFEVLDCAPSSVRLDRLNNGGALLVDHNTRDQIGVVVRAWVDAATKTCRAIVKFSKSTRAEEIFQDVLDGIRSLVSVGYDIDSVVLSSQDNGVNTYRVMDWTALELSIVAVPADSTVGIGREHEPFTKDNNPMKRALKLMDPETPNRGNSGGTTPTTPAPVTPAVQVTSEADIRTAERARSQEIRAIGTRAKVPAGVLDKAIDEGWSVDQFRKEVLDKHMPGVTPVGTNGGADIGMSERERGRYSLLRAMGRLANNKPLEGMEKEASDQVAKNVGRDAQGFFVPSDVQTLTRSVTPERARALNAEIATAGGYFVQETVLGDSMIELLRNETFINQLGITNLTGLVGDIAIPRQSGGATTYWLGEQADTPASDQVIGQMTLRPRRLAALTAYTKQLLAQSSIGVELFVRQDLMKQLAIAKDYAAINGTGSGGMPLGILNTTGVGSITFGAAATWVKVVGFETALATANALRASPAFLTTPAVRGAWKCILKATGAMVNGSSFLWEGDQVNGYRALATNQVPSDKVIYGNFADLVVADWDGLDVVVDPYSLAGKNQVRIVIMLMTDLGLRHPLSFVVSSDSGAQ